MSILLFQLVLIAFVDLSTGDPILNLFKKETDCKLNSFLIDGRNHFKLYFSRADSLRKVDVESNELIRDGPNLKFLSSSDDYFTGCMVHQNKRSDIYLIIYQNRIIKLGKDFLIDGNFSYIPVNLTLKDNPRLFVHKFYDSNQSNKSVYEFLVSSSSNFSIERNLQKLWYNKTLLGEVNLVANNLAIEYNLLQGLLNQDYELFSSAESAHVFIENDLLLLWDKGNHSVHQLSRSFLCSDSRELSIFLNILFFFSSILFFISILVDYISPFNFDLNNIIKNLKNQDDNEQIKYCLDTKSLLDKNRSEESIKTINSAGMTK